MMQRDLNWYVIVYVAIWINDIRCILACINCLIYRHAVMCTVNVNAVLFLHYWNIHTLVFKFMLSGLCRDLNSFLPC